MRNDRPPRLYRSLLAVLASFRLLRQQEDRRKRARACQYKVRLQTTKGDVVILVHRDWSPLGADHFYELTKMGFYDDNRFSGR